MKDKDHLKFMSSYENIIKNVTLIDIPSQDGAILKEEFKNKIDCLNFKLSLSDSIEDAIKSLAKNNNTIILIVGSLYLIGEVLNLG